MQTTSASQITCRVSETGVSDASAAELLVFLRTSEEAQSDVVSTFNFMAPTATMTGMSNSFDAATNSHVFSVSGSGFPAGDLSGVSMYIDGVEQETLDVTSTQATFKVIDASSEESCCVKVYFADGLASGYDAFTSATMSPTLVSISPSTGSSGGTLITVTGTGFGTSTTGLNLVHSASGTEICSEVTISEYGSFTCLTQAMEISSSDQINIKTDSGSYSCGNSVDASACNFE